jgi:peptidoglycan hydrolase-like protein with peptidoglycan-binding domain
MRSLRLAAALSTAGLLALLPTTSDANPSPTVGQAAHGVDISWPNCPPGMGIPERRSQGQPMPSASSTFAVLGLTNGPGFYPNPCLANQVRAVKARHLRTGVYSIVTFPTGAQLARYGGSGTPTARLYRAAQAEARFNLDTLHRAGIARAPMIWIDVEPVRGWPWSRSTANNNTVVSAVIAQYRHAGMRVGIYSYRSGWNEITGGRRINDLATWVPLSSCTKASFSGGPIWMTQTSDGHSDFDMTCPGITGIPAHRHPLTAFVNTRLTQGSTGSAVAALQRSLRLPVDGRFSSTTRYRVVAFQRAHHLTSDGVVTNATWRALGAGQTVPATRSRMPELFLST